jgi:ribosomal protein S18 acetylase RimI-like enzyme
MSDPVPVSAAPRVRLRPITADGESVNPWLPEAVAAIQGRGTAPDSTLSLDALLEAWDRTLPAGATFIGERSDGLTVGLLRARTSDRERLVIDALTVRADRRNLGHGQEMVCALEETFGQMGGMVYAGVPRTNGLAIYFWLRTGYRPLYPPPSDWPDDLDRSRFWMQRRLTQLPAHFSAGE